MEDPNDLSFPNASDGKKNVTDKTMKIVLEPVKSSFDEAYPSTSGSTSVRPKRLRLKRKWPPRSPSPSPSPTKKIQAEQKDLSDEEEYAFQVQKVEGDTTEELSSEDIDILEDVFYYENESSEEADQDIDTRSKQRHRGRSKAQPWQHVCSMPTTPNGSPIFVCIFSSLVMSLR